MAHPEFISWHTHTHTQSHNSKSFQRILIEYETVYGESAIRREKINVSFHSKKININNNNMTRRRGGGEIKERRIRNNIFLRSVLSDWSAVTWRAMQRHRLIGSSVAPPPAPSIGQRSNYNRLSPSRTGSWFSISSTFISLEIFPPLN